jgi:hypothetical protein
MRPEGAENEAPRGIMVMPMVNSHGPLPGLATDSAEMSRGLGSEISVY